MNLPSSYLVTVHGSIVWYEEKTNTLRHAIGMPAQRSLMVEGRGSLTALVARTAGGSVPIDSIRADGRLGRSPGGAPLLLQRKYFADGLFSLEANGAYLCAEADGTMSLTRDEQGPWELFLAIDDADLDWLAYIAGRSWLSATSDSVVPGTSIRPANGFSVQVGQITLRLVDFLATRASGGDVDRITLHYDTWKVEQLSAWRPLIYMMAFGKDEIFESLRLSLQSIRQFGHYDGDILIFTDRMPDQIAHFVPPGMEKQIKLATSPVRDVLDCMATKFRISEIQHLSHYQPLLYLDTDVICDRPIEPVLRRIHRAERICVALEHDLLGGHNFYGANLFAADPTARPRDPRGCSSGLIGIPDMATARHSFPAILTSLYGTARAAGNRHPSDWYDQPVVNYVLHKTDSADFSTLTPYVVTPVDLTAPLSTIRRLGFAHFCGGVGNTETKLPAMRAYLELLRQAD